MLHIIDSVGNLTMAHPKDMQEVYGEVAAFF